MNRSKYKNLSLRGLAVMLALGTTLTFTGCRSAQDKANDAALAHAEQIAASTGTPQRVTWTDTHGNTVTSIVQPPAPGQNQQQIATTTVSTNTSGGSTTQTTTTKTRMVPLAHAPALAAAPVPADSAALAPANEPDQNGNYPSQQPAYGPGGPNKANPANGPYPQNGIQQGIQNGAQQGFQNGDQQSASPAVITPVSVHVRRGTTLAIRINQHISVKSSRAGQGFTGEVVRPVYADGSNRIAIPERTPVYGVIDAAHRRGHFKGRSILELRLTSMELNGQRYALDTRDDVRSRKGKGRRTAALIGGGAGLGMLVGGVASGGVGLLVGGLAGGGAGTAISGLTGNRDIEIPAESVVNFRLADDLTVQPQ